MITREVKDKYRWHRNNAKRRQIEFNISIEDWFDIWQQSGKWHLRGRGKNAYVMSRIGDVGPYTKDNVVIKTQVENAREGWAKVPKRVGFTHTEENKAKFRKRMMGNQYRLGIPHTEETKLKMSEARKARNK